MRIKMVEKLVEDALRTNPSTRGDDFVLVLEVFKSFMKVDMCSIDYALRNHEKFKLPAFASIIRARRKLQANDESLIDQDALRARREQEEEILDYVREDVAK